MSKLNLVFLAMSLALVACADGGNAAIDAQPTIDTMPIIDTVPIIDAVPTFDGAFADASSACILQPSYADLTLGTQGAPGVFNGQLFNGNFAIGVLGTVANVVPKEGLLILLTENAGAFTGGFANGVTTTDPVDTRPSCGGCLEGYGGYTNSTTDAQQYYIPSAGALTMTVADAAVAGGTSRFEGVFNNVTMQGYDAATDTLLSPACTTTVNNLSFVWDVTWP